MTASIKRTLVRDGLDNGWHKIRQDEIDAIRGPAVILGDSGLGKTELAKWLGERPGMRHVPAGKFERHADPGSLINPGERIVIDGLDEVASAEPGGAVDAVLRQLSRAGNPTFILTCREADWQGAAARAKIEQDYATDPILLRLQPFSANDTYGFLSQEFLEINTDELLDHLMEHGIWDLSGNPLTLRMLGEVAQRTGRLPDSRTDLFDRACRVMLEERNRLHKGDPRARRPEDELLLAAGAICAAQLICDRAGVYAGPVAETPGHCLNVAELERFPSGDAAADVLGTRLFQAEGENRFTCIHRAVAEYLGANWLTHRCNEGVPERRIFALLGQAATVSFPLHGLYGWIPCFDSALADRCIAVDPHGVLHHGDVDRLGLDRARNLLDALKESRSLISRPRYRRPDRHPASGLMRVELKEDVLGVIERAGLYVPLALILPEVLPGTELAPKLKTDLVAMLFDGNHHYEARSCAWKVLRAIDDSVDWKGIIYRLLAMEDRESQLLASEVAAGISADSISSETVLDTALACLGLASAQFVARKPSLSGWLPAGFPGQVDADRGTELLDGLVEHARPVMDAASASARAGIADLVRRLVARVIELQPSTEADRVWGWLCWLDGSDGSDSDARNRLATTFRKNEALRAALLQHVLLGPCAGNPAANGARLNAARVDLYPSSEDLAGTMTVLRDRTAGAPVDRDVWYGLLLLDRSAGGLPVVLREAAAASANGDPGLLAVVDGISDAAALQQRAKEEERKARRQVERERVHQRCRSALAGKAAAFADGNVEVLELPAEVYLGRTLFQPDGVYSFCSVESPEGRLRTFFGDAVSSQVLDGFIAVLGRDDLPGTSEVSRMLCEGEPFAARFPMLCGIAEMLRRGLEIDSVKRATLAAAYMALPPRWQPFPFDWRGVRDALEKALFRSDADWEAHFRVSIEPQLARDADSVDRMAELIRSHRHSNLAGRLAVEWLRDCPALSPSRREQLLECALKNALPETVRELVVDCRPDTDADDQTRLFWLSADYLADFDDRREVLEREAADNRDFLWCVRDRIVPTQRLGLDGPSAFETNMARLSVAQLAFIVQAFGADWPPSAQHAGVATSEGRHSRDAAKFIDCAINAIAGHPTPEATEALEGLSADGPPGYVDTARQALEYQLSVRKARAAAAPTVGELRAAITNDLPENIDDMRAWFADRVEMLQERIRGSNTNMWEAYPTACGEPRDENYCRDRMIDHISQHLPPSIRLEREGSAPGNTRMDIALVRNQIKLPVEIKCRWHRKVWDAAIAQLAAKYTVDWQAKGCGAYVVLWFGDVPGKRLPASSDGLEQPQTPEELRRMLKERLPEGKSSLIDVFVVDVSRPAAAT